MEKKINKVKNKFTCPYYQNLKRDSLHSIPRLNNLIVITISNTNFFGLRVSY